MRQYPLLNAGNHISLSPQVLSCKDGTQYIPVESDALPVLFKGFEPNKEDTKHFLVTFSGAVSGRKEKSPPFFSGNHLSEELGLPLLAFSDPTLKMSDEIGLAFYAGNENCPQLAIGIAKLIDDISAQYKMTPILVGGSGGGFASLNVSRHCKCKPSLCVWNPQTKISEYDKTHVDEYLRVAFPSRYMPGGDVKAKAVNILNYFGVQNSVVGWNGLGNIVYLQNRSDWHLKAHLSPFLDSISATPQGRSTFINERLNAGVFVGEWGDGHIPPPREMIADVITKFTQAEQVKDILSDLEISYSSPEPTAGIASVKEIPEGEISVYAWRNKSTITAAVDLPDIADFSAFDFAFYLEGGGQVIEKIWYAKSNVHNFNCEDERIEGVIFFIRDEFGNMISKKCPIKKRS